MGYANKNILGGYDYQFTTLQAEEPVSTVQVGITTDTDLLLKNAQGSVDYRSEVSTMELAPMASSAYGAVSYSDMDSFYNQIGQGRIIKNASNLAALEAFSVEGAFADSYIKLYSKEILIGLVIVTVLIVVAVFVLKHIRRRLKSHEEYSEAAKKSFLTSPFSVAFWTSFLSAIGVALYTGMLVFVSQYGFRVFDLGYGMGQTLITLMIVVISITIYALLILGPASIVGVKKGAVWGVVSALMVVCWLVLFVVAIAIVTFLLVNPYGVGSIQPAYY